MANDVGQLCTRIISDLNRGTTSLSDVLLPYIQSVVLDYEGTRFYFNERELSITISSTQTYTLALFTGGGGNSYADLIEVDNVEVTVSGRNYTLTETSWNNLGDIDSGVGTLQGYPQLYAFFNQAIKIWPMPNQAMTMTVSAHVKFIELATMADTNAWTTDGRNLLRYGTMVRYVGGALQRPDLAALYNQGEQRALAELLRRTDALSGHTITGSF